MATVVCVENVCSTEKTSFIFLFFSRASDERSYQKTRKSRAVWVRRTRKALSRKREMLSNYSTCSIHDGKRKVHFFVSVYAACYPTVERSIAGDKWTMFPGIVWKIHWPPAIIWNVPRFQQNSVKISTKIIGFTEISAEFCNIQKMHRYFAKYSRSLQMLHVERCKSWNPK